MPAGFTQQQEGAQMDLAIPNPPESSISAATPELEDPRSAAASSSAESSEVPSTMADLRSRRYTRPFASWTTVSGSFPGHLEVKRFNALPAHQQERAWLDRRRHVPCDLEVPSAWDLDALYFRAPEEEEYARALHKLWQPSATVPAKLSVQFLCFPKTLIPFRW
jgi:hypothetical protein